MLELFQSEGHRNLCVNDLSLGHMVHTNQHIIEHNNEAVVLDPGGHKIFSRLVGELGKVMPMHQLKYILLSHQDPDIVAAINGWLMTTDANAYISKLWMRFITHFGIDEMVLERITPIEDRGMVLNLGGQDLLVIPGHFLHSCGNFHVYDPVSKIYYSGDLGASIGAPYGMVEDFEAHIQYMEPFHRRYIPSGRFLKMWAKTVSQLDVETIAPQHGALMPGKMNVAKFIAWVQTLSCGIDLMGEAYPLPAK